MTFAKPVALAATLLLCLAPACAGATDLPLLAAQNGIRIEDGYARAAGGMAQSGAAFMRITNTGTTDDRLIGARSAAAERLELHTHVVTDGVARMQALADGIPVPAGATVALERGGLHVMFLGLGTPWRDGDALDVTLSFARAGDIAVKIPVDLTRQPGAHGHGAGH